jgi:hypothetical protein
MLQTAAFLADKWSDIAATGGFFFFPLFPFVTISGLVLEGSGERHEHQWAGPVTFAVTGLVFIGLALFLARRSRPPLAEI